MKFGTLFESGISEVYLPKKLCNIMKFHLSAVSTFIYESPLVSVL